MVIYSVSRQDCLWAVAEDGVLVDTVPTPREAIDLAQLLTVCVKATGGAAALVVTGELGTAEVWNADLALSRSVNAAATSQPASAGAG